MCHHKTLAIPHCPSYCSLSSDNFWFMPCMFRLFFALMDWVIEQMPLDSNSFHKKPDKKAQTNQPISPPKIPHENSCSKESDRSNNSCAKIVQAQMHLQSVLSNPFLLFSSAFFLKALAKAQKNPIIYFYEATLALEIPEYTSLWGETCDRTQESHSFGVMETASGRMQLEGEEIVELRPRTGKRPVT